MLATLAQLDFIDKDDEELHQELQQEGEGELEATVASVRARTAVPDIMEDSMSERSESPTSPADVDRIAGSAQCGPSETSTSDLPQRSRSRSPSLHFLSPAPLSAQRSGQLSGSGPGLSGEPEALAKETETESMLFSELLRQASLGKARRKRRRRVKAVVTPSPAARERSRSRSRSKEGPAPRARNSLFSFVRAVVLKATEDKLPSLENAPRARPRVTCEAGTLPHAAVDQDGFLVVYKPPGWTATTTSNRGDQRRKIQSWILDTYGEVYPYLLEDQLQAGIVHRLDIQTTGPMVVATRLDTYQELCYSIGRLTWYKEYLALVHGAIPEEMSKGRLTYRLHVPKTWGQRLWRTEVSSRGGLPAETQFQALRVYRRDVKGLQTPRFYTLVRIRLITGRTHQIRVHFREFAKRLGLDVCGLVGDHIYLPRNQLLEDQAFCDRIFLHERRLEFPHPNPGKEPVRILCTLPPDLMKALSRCEVHHRFSWREFSGKVPTPVKPRVSFDEFGEVVVNRPPSPWRPPVEPSAEMDSSAHGV